MNYEYVTRVALS